MEKISEVSKGEAGVELIRPSYTGVLDDVSYDDELNQDFV